MKFKRILLIPVFIIFISTVTFASGEDINITVNGEQIHTDVSPKIVKDRTLVPMRVIFEALGAELHWNNQTQIVVGIKDCDTIVLQVNNSMALVNGKEILFDIPTIAENERILVPTRLIAESLGSDVKWDNDTRTVVIKDIITDEKYFEFDKNKGEITRYDEFAPTNLVIPSTIDGVAVKSIADQAFNNRSLTSVEMPKSITKIGTGAFGGNYLTSVEIPKGVTHIGNSAFVLNNLVSVKLPRGLKRIDYAAFAANKITSLELPQGIEIIEDSSFAQNKLTKVRIPKSVKGDVSGAFGNDVELIIE